MESATTSLKPSRWRTFWKIVAVGSLVWVIAVSLVVIEIVTLSRDAGALRNEMLAALDVRPSARIQFTVGPALLSVAHLGLTVAHGVPEDAVQALSAARSASVGIYSLRGESGPAARVRMFAAADQVMSHRGWTRVIGVNNATETVAIFSQTESRNTTEQHLCIAVCQDRKLIVVEARVDGEGLAALAGRHVPQFALK